MHPYLARQMSDFGFRGPLRGSNSGVRAKNSSSPVCLLANLTTYLDGLNGKETRQFTQVRATLRCKTLLLLCGGLASRGLMMN